MRHRFAFYGRTTSPRLGTAHNWQWYRSNPPIEPHGGVIVAEFFDIGHSRSLPWQRPEASALLKARPGPGLRSGFLGGPAAGSSSAAWHVVRRPAEHLNMGLMPLAFSG
jgi:hypothetical protein